MTYNEAYNKIIEAYFKDEIRPMSTQFCFCGTLAVNVKEDNFGHEYWDDERYSRKEYSKMEEALMIGLEAQYVDGGWLIYSVDKTDANYEEKLFKGMSMALDVLKQIHIERGEVIDEVPEFTKRNLAHV